MTRCFRYCVCIACLIYNLIKCMRNYIFKILQIFNYAGPRIGNVGHQVRLLGSAVKFSVTAWISMKFLYKQNLQGLQEMKQTEFSYHVTFSSSGGCCFSFPERSWQTVWWFALKWLTHSCTTHNDLYKHCLSSDFHLIPPWGHFWFWKTVSRTTD